VIPIGEEGVTGMLLEPFSSSPVISSGAMGLFRKATWFLIVFLVLLLARGAYPQQKEEQVDEINAEFHFLGPNDSLLIHEEGGRLNGQINLAQGENESDAILCYLITIGSRQKNRIEFKTSKVHEKYFRFTGTVERGAGHKGRDPDFLRLVGDVEMVTVNGDTGKETTEHRRVVLKSLGADEMEE